MCQISFGIAWEFVECVLRSYGAVPRRFGRGPGGILYLWNGHSFAWNRGVTFRAGAFHWGELARFATVNGASMALSAIGMGLLSREGWPL